MNPLFLEKVREASQVKETYRLIAATGSWNLVRLRWNHPILRLSDCWIDGNLRLGHWGLDSNPGMVDSNKIEVIFETGPSRRTVKVITLVGQALTVRDFSIVHAVDLTGRIFPAVDDYIERKLWDRVFTEHNMSLFSTKSLRVLYTEALRTIIFQMNNPVW